MFDKYIKNAKEQLEKYKNWVNSIPETPENNRIAKKHRHRLIDKIESSLNENKIKEMVEFIENLRIHTLSSTNSPPIDIKVQLKNSERPILNSESKDKEAVFLTPVAIKSHFISNFFSPIKEEDLLINLHSELYNSLKYIKHYDGSLNHDAFEGMFDDIENLLNESNEAAITDFRRDII